MTGIPKKIKEHIKTRENNELKEAISNYWVVAIPNFILLGLSLGIEQKNKRDKQS